MASRLLISARRAALLALLVACGSRTGLFEDDTSLIVTTADGGSSSGSSGSGVGIGSLDASDDVVSTLDARTPTDVDRSDCPDADALLVYTITENYDLQSFNPASGSFRTIGHISCPAPTVTDQREANTPFSMAVDRRGIAYVLFRDEHLYRVSTATGACIATDYQPLQGNFGLFGMGFTTDRGGPTETLYVAGDGSQGDGIAGIAKIDPTTFKLDVVTTSPTVQEAELTGTGDGRLYAFYNKNPRNNSGGDTAAPSYIGEIDTTTGNVIGERRFDTISQGHAWAFAFWAGDFYMFHAGEGDPTTVTRWRPSDDSVTDVATASDAIVGAGVSTCAPQQ